MEERNVLGGVLHPCCHRPKTGFYRDGFCRTGRDDLGEHAICVIATQEFLEFSRSRGNDLMTPIPMYGFDGVKPGQPWCLCALRWVEAYDAGVAPQVVLESTHESMLRYVSLEILQKYAVSEHNADKGLIYSISSGT